MWKLYKNYKHEVPWWETDVWILDSHVAEKLKLRFKVLTQSFLIFEVKGSFSDYLVKITGRWNLKKTDFHNNLNNLHLSIKYRNSPPEVLLGKVCCSENIQQIYRRIPMPKYDFNEVAKQLTYMHIFRTPFPENTSRELHLQIILIK